MAGEYPPGIEPITYLSKADGTGQPALFWKAEDQSQPAPLLVVLHTWSGDYRQASSQVPAANWCQQLGWTFIHPNFRGQNWKPEALGSELVVGDIISAVDFAKQEANVDVDRIYCIGVSGGGHASLLMAARAPEIWAGVSAWCGISDIAAWHRQCSGTKFVRYAEHIEKALGGKPEDFPEDARNRSPITWLEMNRDRLPTLDIWHGINDGRDGSVPFTQSLRAWNISVAADQRIPEEKIAQWYRGRDFAKADLPDFGDRKVWYQKQAGQVRVSIFEGGHEILPEPALNWLAAQRKESNPAWNPPSTVKLKKGAADTESGK